MTQAAGAANLSAANAIDRDQEELLGLLYLCPCAIIKIDTLGSILLMNPYGTQILMPLSQNGQLENLFDIFSPFAPEVAEMAQRFSGRAGRVCEEHRVMLPMRSAKIGPSILSITLQKVDADTFVAVLTDVTSAARREVAIRASEERLHAVLDGVREYAICTADMDGIITSWNSAAARLDDYRGDETIGQHLDLLVPSTGSSKSAMKRGMEIALRDDAHDFEGWRVRKDARRYWAKTAIGVLRAKDGRTPIGFSIITQDLTEQRRAEDHLRSLAMTDPLTGALNRRSFFEQSKAARARSAVAGAFTIFMIDADFFKHVNDVHGHEAGDTVLQRIVADCRKELRTSDVLGRFGGEEFAVLLPASTTDTGRIVAERIRERIEASGRVAGSVPCTVSIGVATSGQMSETVEEVIARADVALYAAKESGRNRVVIADSPAAAVPETVEPVPTVPTTTL